MTRVVVAPDSFKGSIPADAAARALAAGIRAADAGIHTVLLPMADGGEGTLAAFAAAVPGARSMPIRVCGPAGSIVAARWLLLPEGTGVVELASTSGIEMLGDSRRGLDADTTGFGQAIAAALDGGIRRLVLGLGSSASTDGGTGMLRMLGARIDGGAAPVRPGARGLREIETVDLTGLRALPPEGVRVLTDVTNPLLGERGAAAVFGPQKGLDAAGVAAAEAGLAHWAALTDPGAADVPGAGAAGGTGFALQLWGAALEPGAAGVAEVIGLSEAIEGADLVVTGEGAFDGQSAAGKAPALVAALAAAHGVPVALVAGRIADDADTTAFAASVSLTELAGSRAASLADPQRWLRVAGAALISAQR